MKRFLHLMLVLMLCSLGYAQTVEKHEFWLDNDFDGRTSVTGQAFSQTIDISALKPGVHFFNHRAIDNEGCVGPVFRKVFIMPLDTEYSGEGATLAKYEWWLDNDYTSRQTVASSDVNQMFTLDLSELKPGVHFFNYRAINSDGYAGPIFRKVFIMPLDTEYSGEGATLAKYEWWLDNDYTSRQTVASSDANQMFTLDLSEFKPGVHFFNYRAINSDGYAGPVFRKVFIMPLDSDSTQPLVGYTYAFDDYNTYVPIEETYEFRMEDVIIDMPRLINFAMIDEGCVFTKSGDAIRMTREKEVMFRIAFVDKVGRQSNSAGTLYIDTDEVEKQLKQFDGEEPLAIQQLAPGDFDAIAINALNDGTYNLLMSKECEFKVFDNTMAEVNSYTYSATTGMCTLELTAGTYYFVVYNVDYTDPDTEFTVRLISNAPAPDPVVVVELEDPGTLEEEILYPDVVESLTITGPINGTDVNFIRTKLPELRFLNIHGAWVVEGGSAYHSTYTEEPLYTSDYTIGDYMFSEMPRLHELMLCSNTNNIGKGIIESSVGLSRIEIPEQVTSVAVGALNGISHVMVLWNADNAVAKADVSDNPNVIIYATQNYHGDAMRENLVKGDVAEKLVLHDGYDLYIPMEFRAREASYTRIFGKQTQRGTAAGWETIVLPFEANRFKSESRGMIAPFGSTQSANAHFYLAELEEDGFVMTSAMEANTPYIVCMPNSSEYAEQYNIRGNVMFYAKSSSGVRVMPTDDAHESHSIAFDLVPSYERMEAADSYYVLNEEMYEGYRPGSVFIPSMEVLPFRPYVMDNTNSGPAYIPVFDGDVTAIMPIFETPSRTDDAVYDLMGIRQDPNHLQKGKVYIVKGSKKVFTSPSVPQFPGDQKPLQGKE